VTQRNETRLVVDWTTARWLVVAGGIAGFVWGLAVGALLFL
jgi:hypothetical protein